MPQEPPLSAWSFGDPASYDARDDLVAIGADLEPGTVLQAYRRGLFPMPSGSSGDPMYWFCPVRRGVLPLDRLAVSRSLRRSSRDFEIRVDTSFDEVIAECADPRRPSGWIDADVREAYRRLHALGWAHSSITRSKAVSTRTSNSRHDRRNERETTSPSSGRTPRRTGQNQYIGSPGDPDGIGNRPRR